MSCPTKEPEMNEQQTLLKVTGAISVEREFSFQDLRHLAKDDQVPDFSRIVPGRPGLALKLAGILEAVQVHDDAMFLGLHSAHDNFHASIPLSEVRERGYVIYGLNDAPLPREQGGPIRFFIPDHAQCKTDEVDECANVKFVDHIELTTSKGFDNRPTDEEEHAKLHKQD